MCSIERDAGAEPIVAHAGGHAGVLRPVGGCDPETVERIIEGVEQDGGTEAQLGISLVAITLHGGGALDHDTGGAQQLLIAIQALLRLGACEQGEGTSDMGRRHRRAVEGGKTRTRRNPRHDVEAGRHDVESSFVLREARQFGG